MKKLVFLVLMFLSFNLYAGCCDRTTNNYYYPTETVEAAENDEVAKAAALAIATYHPFDFATNKWQASVNAAVYDGEDAVSFAAAKRFEDTDVLIHTSYGQNNGKHAITIGGLWRF